MTATPAAEGSGRVSPPDTRLVRVLSNLPRLSPVSLEDVHVVHTLIGDTVSIRGMIGTIRQARRHDVVLLNIESRLLLLLCVWRMIWPFERWKLVSLDLVLNSPVGPQQRLAALMKRMLFKKVTLFVLYFKDIAAYGRWYGITPDRTCYVPFKVNIWPSIRDDASLTSDGDYVLAAGRSRRDFETFLLAMSFIDCPGVLLHQSPTIIAQHGTRLPEVPVPSNVRTIEDHGGEDSWVRFLRGARVVAVVTLKDTISPSGISTYLDAMALKKCVVATEGPATRDLLTDEAILVPPGDAQALANAITAAWNDSRLRTTTAERGQAYAKRLQGEERLLHDVMKTCVRLTDGR